jgi:glycosyltransferase involved in cell wall biosynthesis
MSNFFSVIMPVYNKEDFVNRAINSVLSQSFKNFELVVVVDESTDSSLEKVLSYRDERITVLRRFTPGPGGYAARNLGILNSHAPWIAFLDADDVWSTDHLQSMFAEIDRHQCNLDMVVMGYESDTGRVCSLDAGSSVLSQKNMLELFAQRDFIHTNCFSVERSVLEATGAFPEGRARQGGDADTWLRIVLTGTRFRVLPRITSFYYSKVGGVIANKKNMKGAHPIVATVKEIQKSRRHDQSTIILLKRISNRKSISWMLHKKMSGYFDLSDFRNIFWPCLGVKGTLKTLLLFLPAPVLRKFIA